MISALMTLCFFILFFILFFGIYPRQSKKRSQKLLDYYKARFQYPLGDVAITYERYPFFISRLSRGGGINNTPAGSYPLLWAYLEATPKLLIGHEQSKDYVLGKFLILPKYQKNIPHKDHQVLIATESTELFSKSLDLTKLKVLFEKKFQHLTINSEIHILNYWPQKKHVMKYTGIPEDIYQDPELLKTYFDELLIILDQLKIKIIN